LAGEYNKLNHQQLNALSSSLTGPGQTAQGTAGLEQMRLSWGLAGEQGTGQLSNLYMQPSHAQLQAAAQQYIMPCQIITPHPKLLYPAASLGRQGTANMQGTSTTTQPVNPGTTAAGIGLGLAAMLPSDKRLKENIRPSGMLFESGL